jgi:hypothetical protein
MAGKNSPSFSRGGERRSLLEQVKDRPETESRLPQRFLGLLVAALPLRDFSSERPLLHAEAA